MIAIETDRQETLIIAGPALIRCEGIGPGGFELRIYQWLGAGVDPCTSQAQTSSMDYVLASFDVGEEELCHKLRKEISAMINGAKGGSDGSSD